MTSFLRGRGGELPLVHNPVGLIREILREAERRVYDTQPPFPKSDWLFLGTDIVDDYSVPAAMSIPKTALRLMSNYPPDFVAAIQLQVERELDTSKLRIWVDFVDSRVPCFASRLVVVLSLIALSVDARDYDEGLRLFDWLDIVGTQAGYLLLRPTRSMVDLFDEV